MMRLLLVALLATALGIGAAEYLTTSFLFRRALGHLVRRGDLQALVGRTGIYDTEVERARRAELFASGAEAEEIHAATAVRQRDAALARLIAEEKLHTRAAGQAVDQGEIAREMNLLRAQFRDEKTWEITLAKASVSRGVLEREVASNLRDRAWLEAQIAPGLQPNEASMRDYFDRHRPAFEEPLRLRSSHLFLVAPDGSPADLIETKRSLIEQLSARLANGESFPVLVTEFSEDEASRRQDGDLNYFAATRMLPEVFAAASKLQPGEISRPIRSRLGFHVLRLTEARLARTLRFEEAQHEIAATLENERRAVAVHEVVRR